MTVPSTAPVLLLDGHNLLFRAFATLPRSITGPGDEPINAVYGMLAAVIRLLREHEPGNIIAAFDEPDIPTFRQQRYPPYQAHRGPLGGEHADEFRRQVQAAQRVLPMLGIPTLRHVGYEADDIMGTVIDQLVRRGRLGIIVSTDKDLLQLVKPGVEVLVPGAAQLHIRDAAGVIERVGVPPKGITTYKALAGDPSDNIPGVAGIGAKTAVKLVNDHGPLEAMYEALDTLPRRTATALANGREDAFLFRELVTIVTNLDLAIDLVELPQPAFGPETRARELLERTNYGQA